MTRKPSCYSPPGRSGGEWALLLAGLFLALVLRVSFSLTTGTPAISNDAPAYLGIARDIVTLARNPSIIPNMLDEMKRGGKSRDELIASAEKYGLKDIRHVNVRLILYPLFIALFQFFTGNVMFISLAQALLGVAACYAAHAWAEKVFGRPAAMATLWITALYPPLIVFSHYIMSEPLSAFLLVLLGYFSHGMLFEQNRRHSLAVGVTLFLMMMCRLSFYLLPLYMFAAYALILFALGAGARRFRAALVPAVAAWLVPTIPWLMVMGIVFGSCMPPGLKGLSLSVGQNQTYRGQAHDDRFPKMSPALERIMRERGHAEPTEDDYKTEAFTMMRDRPAGVLFMFVEKAGRLWGNPYNEYNAGFPLPFPWQRHLHKALLLLGIAGLAASCLLTRRALPAAALLLFATVTHGMVLSGSRYNLPLMHVWIMFAGATLVRSGWFAKKLLRNPVRGIVFAASAGLTALYLSRWTPFPLEEPAAYFKVLGIAGLSGLFFAALPLLSSLKTEAFNPLSKICAWGIFLSLYCLLALMIAGNRAALSWTCPLSSGSDSVTQRVSLPELDEKDIRAAWIYIDVLGEPSNLSPLEISLNAAVIKRAGIPARVDTDKFQLLTGTYFHYFKYMKLSPADVRQWRVFPVDKNSLRRENDILLQWKSGAPGTSRLQLAGDFYLNRKDRTFILPYFAFSAYETSFFQFIDMQDYRITHTRRLDSPAAQSAFFKEGKPLTRDLCPVPGYQRGQYRIRIVVKTSNGRRLIF